MKTMHLKIIIIITFLFNIISALGQSIDINIMSFNIQQPYGNNWDERKDSAVAILIQEDMDIIGTQEAIKSQRDYLLDNSVSYSYYGLGRDGGDSGEGSWIFYKKEKYRIDSANSGNFWLSDTPEVPSRFGGDYNRICTYVRLVDTATQKAFYIFNAHFPTPDLQSARLKSMKLMAKRMAEKSLLGEPVLATGDFNSSENNAVTKWMKNGDDNPLQCRDTYRDFDPDGNVTTGFGSKYDYIYCENTLKYLVDSSWVIKSPTGASDHMPIAASISLVYAIDSNAIPIAHAGIDQNIALQPNENNASVTLDASLSYDYDGTIDKYEWYAADSLLIKGVNPEIDLHEGYHPIYLKVTDNLGAMNTNQVLITVKLPNALQESKSDQINIYPQPVTNTVYIRATSGSVEKLKIYNTNGTKIIELSDTAQVDMTDYSRGLYIFEVQINGKQNIRKVMKE